MTVVAAIALMVGFGVVGFQQPQAGQAGVLKLDPTISTSALSFDKEHAHAPFRPKSAHPRPARPVAHPNMVAR